MVPVAELTGVDVPSGGWASAVAAPRAQNERRAAALSVVERIMNDLKFLMVFEPRVYPRHDSRRNRNESFPNRTELAGKRRRTAGPSRGSRRKIRIDSHRHGRDETIRFGAVARAFQVHQRATAVLRPENSVLLLRGAAHVEV